MVESKHQLKRAVLILAASLCLGITNIDSAFKYSWGENIGWMNWRDANGGTQGAELCGSYLCGYIWSENVGWIDLGDGTPTNGTQYANSDSTDYGVNLNTSTGNLNGLAWSENIGWINFDTTTALASFGQQARYDAASNRFRGYAWCENVGWINLDEPTYYVAVGGAPTITITQWRSVRTHTGAGELAIVLNATATTTATVETRGATTPAQGVFKVQVDFSGPVTLVNGANIAVTYRPTIQGGSPSIGSPVSVIPSSVVMADADTLDMIFTAGQIPNMGCANIAIGAGTFAETLTGDTDCNIRVLASDVNSSGTVNTTDQSQIKAAVTAALATTTPRFDLNLSGGTINTTDQSVMKAQVISPAKTALCP